MVIVMKYYKTAGNDNSIRKVYNNSHTILYGVVGKVKDLLEDEIFEYCDYPGETWVFVSCTSRHKDCFGKTRESVTKHIVETP